MVQKLIAFDQWLFVQINGSQGNPTLDNLMLFFRNPLFWAPLYLFLLTLIIINFGKKGLWWVLFAAANAALSDTISSHFLKQLFGRPRPCGDFYFSSHVKLLANYCGANGSFPSSHATNHFALAMFFFVTLKPLKGRWQYLFFLWAAIICFAQVYVGVHYPSDIVGGTILGCFIGWVMGNYFNTKVGALA